MSTQLTIGSLFSGYGGLDLAVERVFNAHTVWQAEWEDAPSAILARHWPDVPNHRDVTAVDWAGLPPVDIITGGFPCQDVSLAGRRAGMTEGARSNLWGAMRTAIETIRPTYVVAENVRGLLSAKADSACDLEPGPGLLGGGDRVALRGLGRVLGDLADLGYDAQWHGLRASDIGAPHHRFRVFILATRRDVADALRCGGDGRAEEPGQAGCDHAPIGPGAGGDGGRKPAGIPDGHRIGGNRAGASRLEEGWREPADRGVSAPDADRDEPQRGRGPAPVAGAPGTGEGREEERQRLWDATGHRSPGDYGIAWGDYEPAIRRWEQLRGPVPAPTELNTKGEHRLSPAFAEWMMGLPAGWVTDTPGITRALQLKALGNGVVPQQAGAALTYMLNRQEAL